MVIEQQGILDWEPLYARVVFGALCAPDPARFQEICLQFLDSRQSDCDCELVFFHIDSFDDAEISFIAERLCMLCLADFHAMLAEAYGNGIRLLIGLESSGSHVQPCSRTVSIPESSVTLENGRLIHVRSFEIATTPVTIGEFREFCERTSYLTSAERAGDPNVYYDNWLLQGLPESDIERTPVNFVSLEDALAYCRWAEARLPSEAEWLAAFQYDSSRGRSGVITHWSLVCIGAEWTRSHDDLQHGIIRRKPSVIDLEMRRQHVSKIRFVVPVDARDEMTTFRIIPISSVNENLH